MSRRVLGLDMGGTIAQVRDSSAALGYESLAGEGWSYLGDKRHAELERIAAFDVLPVASVDSTEIGPLHWAQCAQAIHAAQEIYDGFVITHGTDTLAYTAAALSFLLCDVDKPICITGAQIPMRDPRTFGRSDGWSNLVSAFQLAAEARLRGTIVVFGDTILRGARTVKQDAFGLTAFHSPNAMPLGRIGVDIRYFSIAEPVPASYAYNTDEGERRFEVDPRVELIKVHPGMEAGLIASRMRSTDPHGLVVETFASGWLPNTLLNALRASVGERPVVVTVETAYGPQQSFHYEPSYWLNDRPFVSGRDMTTPAAVLKLMWALVRTSDLDTVRELLMSNIANELTPGLKPVTQAVTGTQE